MIASPLSASAAEGEHIFVSGGPALRGWENLRKNTDQHDRFWHNFVRKAKWRMVDVLKEEGPNTQLTWLVYKPAYERRAKEEGRPLVEWVESVIGYFKETHEKDVKLVWYNSGDDIIRYINSGKSRRKNKVVMFEYFGHSNRHAFLLDYSSAVMGASKAWLHENDLSKIKRSAFARDAFCRSFGCHTGESMSKAWNKATGVRMWGVQGKTDYSDERTVKVSPGGHWKY
ncbi:MAG: hypothetical protein ACI8XO_004483 [Verrucomicrobiales bacterium]|jgi:hypothetical protein